MLNLCDHAANRRRILKFGDTADLVELEADQRRTLRVMAADRAAGLLDLDHLCGLGHRHKLQIASLAWHDPFGKPTSSFPDRAPRIIRPPLRLRLPPGAPAGWPPCCCGA